MALMEEGDIDVAMIDGEGHDATFQDHGPTEGVDAGSSCGFEQFNNIQGFDVSTSDDIGEIDDSDSPPESIDQPIMKQPRRGQLSTGLCYDDRMKLHANADFGGKPHHPEDPGRIEHIFGKFKKEGLLFKGTPAEALAIKNINPTEYMWRIPARSATENEICTVHTPTHYAWVRNLSTKSTAELRRITKIMDAGRESIYVGSMTFEAALISVGGAIETCKAVVSGRVKNGFAVIRPPGHHAEYDCAMGFCMFNNVPVAARVCQKAFPDACRKVLILDWDVHHGNGIQNIFYDDPNVLYISTHVYSAGTFYPGQPENPSTPDGGLDKCGADAGSGKNVNIGWHDQGMGDGEYMAAFQRIIMPIAQEFDPDLVIISAGFDAADGDELGGCFVTPGCYAHMTHMLMSLANGKVAVCLEGGYNLTAISNSALAVARTLMGEPPPRMVLPGINKEAAQTLDTVRAIQAAYWDCMRPGIVNVPEIVKLEGRNLTDVLRMDQKTRYFEKYKMLSMYIQRHSLFRTYENQVLVSLGIETAENILVVLHDPPEIVAQPDTLNNSIGSENSWVRDGTEKYIEWAHSKNFGIMDVNIPRHVPGDTVAFSPIGDEKRQEAEIKELICYLWDNYLQLWNSEHIMIMGVGNAYIGCKMLLLNRSDLSPPDCKSKLSGVVNFVTGNLRPVRSDFDESLTHWYRTNSRVFVSNDHACWLDPAQEKKVRKKRFGMVIRSPQTSLAAMMHHHTREVQEFILSRSAGERESTETEEMAMGRL
ncbi:unnamed protein product [Discula destructiva]